LWCLRLGGPTSSTTRRASHCTASPSRLRSRYSPAASSFYERYYSGDPVRLAGTLYGLYDKDTHIDRIIGMLDDLESRDR
jgi:hypothetical protein